MYMGRRVRFFCVTGPRGLEWSDIGHRYLKALVDAGVAVRAIPIGAAHFQAGTGPKSDPRLRHWAEISDVFFGGLEQIVVNVVCAPPGLTWGTKATARQFAPPGVAASDEVVIDRQLALEALHTASASYNVAITSPLDETPLDHLVALRRYDLVATLTTEESDRLSSIDVRACAETPEVFAQTVARLLQE